MPRFCKATNRWRNRRVLAAGREEWRRNKRKQKPKPQDAPLKKKPKKVHRVHHDNGYVIDYHGPPHIAGIRTVVSGDYRKPLPTWPGW